MRRSKLEKSFRWALIFCRKGEVNLALQFFSSHDYSDNDYYASYKIYLDCQELLNCEPQELLDRALYDEKQEMLARIAKRTSHPDILLALGDVYYENSDFDLCFKSYERAASLGNYSGFYCAAQAAESINDNKELSEYVAHSRDPLLLYEQAASRGHLFAKGRLLYLKCNGGWREKLRYQRYRFLIRPILGLCYLIADRAHENCIPWK